MELGDFVKDNDTTENISMPNLECTLENMPAIFVRLIELVKLLLHKIATLRKANIVKHKESCSPPDL